jgi:hypothetical protein
LEITAAEAAEVDDGHSIAPARGVRRFTTSRPRAVEDLTPDAAGAEPGADALVGGAGEESEPAGARRRGKGARSAWDRPDEAAKTADDAARPDGAGERRARGGAWTPAGVPPPSYTTVSGAPRWEPKPLTSADYAQARRAAARATQRAAEEARAEGVETAATGQIRVPGRIIFSDGALDLDRAIAARRRAAGGN